MPNPKAGGMADVYSASDLDEQGRRVAVKLLRYLPDQDAILVESFRRETDALQRLEHPNIVKLIEAGQDRDTGRYYLALEWVDTDLSEYLRERPFDSWDDFFDHVGRPILAALEFAHSRQRTHRDLKPANVLIAPGYPPKLADFGIAKLHAFMQSGVTLADYGSRPYAPPDPDEGQFYFSRDVYGFAVLCVRCVSGRELREREDVDESLTPTYFPNDILAVLRECLLPDAAKRPAHAGILKARLEAIQLVRRQKAPHKATCWLEVPVRHVAKLQATMQLPSQEAVAQRLSDELRGPCAIEPYGSKGTAGDRSTERPHFMIHASACRMHVTIEERGDHLFVFNAWTTSQSDCEKAREFAWEPPFDFRLGRPKNVIEGESVVRDLILGIEEHQADLRAARAQREEERLFSTWSGLLKARRDLERERTPPIRYRDRILHEEIALFKVDAAPRADLVGSPWRIRLANNTYIKGEIVDVGTNEVSLLVTYGDPTQFPVVGTLELDTRAADVAIGRQQTVLDDVRFGRAVEPRLRELLLNPSLSRSPTQVDGIEFSQDLDEAKRRAVEQALGVRDLLVIEGPPGTGKTTFIAETIVQLLRRAPASRLLLTSQTHVALDNALERIRKIAPELTMVRVASRFTMNRVAPSIKDLTLDSAVQRWRSSALKSGDNYLQHWATANGLSKRDAHVGLLLIRVITARDVLARLESTLEEAERDAYPAEEQERLSEEIRLQRKQLRGLETDLGKNEELAEELLKLGQSDLRREVDAFLPPQGPAQQLRRMMELHSEWSERFGRGAGFEAALLSTASVVAGTCLGVLNVKGSENVDFDYCIVDEASKATATEVLVPLARSRRFIIVGDPKQLSPFQDPELEEKGLLDRHGLSREDAQQSLLDLLVVQLPEDCRAKLTIQHRMVKAIGDLVSNCFYNGELQSSRAESDRVLKLALARPVTWRSTSGLDGRREQNAGESFANHAEVREVIFLLDRLNTLASKAQRSYTVAVLSGYAGQAAALRRHVGDKEIGWPALALDINTVDAFQGREADITIYSVTRSNSDKRVGFLSEQKRLNVALSRGRDYLVIIGDHQFCRDLETEQPIQQVAMYIESHPDDCALFEVTK